MLIDLSCHLQQSTSTMKYLAASYDARNTFWKCKNSLKTDNEEDIYEFIFKGPSGRIIS